MITSILQEMNSPTLQREYRPDAGSKLYEKITNKDGYQFPAIIDYWMTGPETFDYNYMVIGDHNIPTNHLQEIIEEVIQKAI